MAKRRTYDDGDDHMEIVDVFGEQYDTNHPDYQKALKNIKELKDRKDQLVVKNNLKRSKESHAKT